MIEPPTPLTHSGVSNGAAGGPTSKCWDEAQKRFLAEITNSRRFSTTAVNDFLQSNYRIDKAISTCSAMKAKADQEYGGKKNRFVRKLLEVLQTVKDVGDAFLECAPESVSLAWSAVSILIKVGTDDLDKCEMISACCENIVTIVLNCRLYENRFGGIGSDGSPIQDIEQKILDMIPNILFQVLDFSWHTNYHLDKNRLVRSFKETFSNTLKDKIESLTAEYQKLRTVAEDAFQERVMQQLSSISGIDASVNELQGRLFPMIEDLTLKLDDIDEKITTHFRGYDIRAKFSDRCQRFSPSETHNKSFMMIFDPIRHDYQDMTLWLFADKSYLDWEDHSNRTSNLFCLKGPRGFGKSVKVTCITKRLMNTATVEHGAIVLFFYFKKGDDTAQFTLKALESLISQLLDHRLFIEDIEMMEQCIIVMDEARHETREAAGLHTPEFIAMVFKKIAALINRPVYILVDAIDECEDRIPGKLMHCLKELCRSRLGTHAIKVLCSARDNVNIESLLCDEVSQSSKNSGKDGEEEDKYKLPADISTILIDEKKNADDIRTYLTKKVETMVLRRSGGRRGEFFNQELQRIVDIIQTKANGNFSYASIAVANLQQPTKSTLQRKLRELPPAMEGMYRRSLEVLTSDERDLVIFALKWVVWGISPVTVLEIVEHYKQIYHPDGDANSENDTPYDPSSNAEVSDTRYHLYNVGRDFFQFDDVTDTISVHLSVKEWIYSEAAQFAELETKKNIPMFSINELGLFTLTVPIPASVAQKGQNLSEITNEREAHLSIAIDILYALNSPHFQQRHLLWNPPEGTEYNKKWDVLWVKDNPPKEESKIETTDESKKVDEAEPLISKDGKTTGGGTEGIVPVLENETVKDPPAGHLVSEVDRDKQTTKSADTSTLEPPVAETETDEEDPEDRQDGVVFYNPIYNSDFDIISQPAPRSLNSELAYTVTEKTSLRMRYEIKNWVPHLRVLEKEWLPEERVGRQWESFWQQLRLLVTAQNWKRLGVLGLPDPTGSYQKSTVRPDYNTAIFSTPMKTAANSGLVMMINFLMDQKIATQEDLNQEKGSFTSIHAGVAFPEVVQTLLRHGVDVNISSWFGETPLVTALLLSVSEKNPVLWKDLLTSARILVEAGADLERSFRGLKPVPLSIQVRDLELFQRIFAKVNKEAVNETDRHGTTMMHYLFGCSGGGINVRTEENAKQFIEAGRGIFNVLLQAGADINAQDTSSRAPLHFAVLNKDFEGVKWLLNSGADVHDVDNEGNTYLHHLSDEMTIFSNPDPVSIARVLVDAGLDVTRKNNGGKTALSMAAQKGNADLVHYIIDVMEEKYPSDRAYRIEQDHHGRTPLYKCAANFKGGVEIATMLVEGLSNDQLALILALSDNDNGLNPLQIAARYSNVEIVEYLLSMGADVGAKSFSGANSIDIAVDALLSVFNRSPTAKAIIQMKIGRYEQCLLKLLAAAPDLDVDLRDLLHVATSSKSAQLLQCVLDRNIDKNVDLYAPNSDGWTLFHVALHADARDFLQKYLPSHPSDSIYEGLVASKIPSRLSSKRKGEHCILSRDRLECWHTGTAL
ncbi:Alpha-latroinsectotoxin [Dactylellina cionopaga]|nr:Alpha-latroinsectotoxin [Dactylellina cionopaga]